MIDKRIKQGLVFAVIILFICVSFQPVFAKDTEKKSSIPVSSGKTLYVGGSGEGNYSRIQDAIDNASDGDTVFVYDDSSPYFENLRINKSISLIGEDKNTTIIDCNRTGYQAILIDMGLSDVTVSGFSITGGKRSGVFISCSSFCIIENNIISSNDYGVWVSGTNCVNNILINNNISNNNVGILIDGSNYNNISYNYISNNFEDGIFIYFSYSNNISFNHISNNNRSGIRICYSLGIINEFGILIGGLKPRHYIVSNNISFNGIGIYIYNLGRNHIFKNNFIFNDKNAYFEIDILADKTRNFWNSNYWNRPRLLPYPIFGKISVLFNMFSLVSFDWHPAKEPFDI